MFSELAKAKTKPKKETKIEPKKEILEETKTYAKIPTNIPTKQQLEEFSFKYRNLSTKNLNMELPKEWMKEVSNIANKMEIKKVLIYRYIIGQFLGKVK